MLTPSPNLAFVALVPSGGLDPPQRSGEPS